MPRLPRYRQPRRRPLLDAGGYTFAEQADRSFDQARIIWTAAVDPGVLCVTASRAVTCSFDLTRVAHSVAIDGEGHEHVAIDDGGGLLRLDVIGGTVCDGPVEMRVHLDCTQAIAAKMLALDRLLRLVGVRDGGRRPRPKDRRLSRLVEGLRIADALAEGASLYEIANGLSDHHRQQIDWPGDGEHLKSSIRRRVVLARRLVSAGPHGVLNHQV